MLNEQDIPIDINAGKLLDWLISRRHCAKDWQRHILHIREKINAAIQDMPACDEIVALLSGTHINYFHCQRIVEILKRTEADTKNLFGRYGSQRMKDWLEVVQLYQKDSCYLAEAAQLLVRSLKYDIPGLKRQIAKLDQTAVELEQRHRLHLKQQQSAVSELHALYRQLGIKGGPDVKAELAQLPQELDQIYAGLEAPIRAVGPTVQLYTAFCSFTTGRDAAKIAERLPLLGCLVANGNCTYYQWKHGVAPSAIEETTATAAAVPVDEAAVTPPATATASNEIDFGEDNSEIDWVIEEGNGSANGNGNGTDSDICLDDVVIVEGEGEGAVFKPAVKAEAKPEASVARGADALRLLDHPDTRRQTLDDLHELCAFLRMRQHEMITTGDAYSALSQLLVDAPDVVQAQTPASVASQLAGLEALMGQLEARRTAHLHHIKHSPSYVDLLAEQMRQKGAAGERAGRAAVGVAQLAKEKAQEAHALRPLVGLVMGRAEELQRQIEADISARYKGRVVHIVGGVQNV